MNINLLNKITRLKLKLKDRMIPRVKSKKKMKLIEDIKLKEDRHLLYNRKKE